MKYKAGFGLIRGYKPLPQCENNFNVLLKRSKFVSSNLGYYTHKTLMKYKAGFGLIRGYKPLPQCENNFNVLLKRSKFVSSNLGYLNPAGCGIRFRCRLSSQQSTTFPHRSSLRGSIQETADVPLYMLLAPHISRCYISGDNRA